jgi:hypothetical protein
MKRSLVVALLFCQAFVVACQRKTAPHGREPLVWSGWIDETAARRGYISPGDVAQFGCPPGWLGVEDTAAAMRGRQASARYVGTAPPPHEGTITCVAQREFALPPPYTPLGPDQDSLRRPLAPVWVDMEADRITVGFRSELPLTAAIYIGRDTPCGPRIIGVRLGDLLKWLSDPQSATKRDFLGMVSAGCPDTSKR